MGEWIEANLHPSQFIRTGVLIALLVLARVPVPARKKGRIEQAIVRRFLNWRTQQARAAAATDGSGPATP